MRAPYQQLTQRLGFAVPALARSLLLLGADRAAFAAALPRLDPLLAPQRGLPVVLGTPDKASWKRLSRERSSELVRLGPHRLGIARWLRRLRPLAVLALEGSAPPPGLAAACRRRGIPLLRGRDGERALAALLPPPESHDWHRDPVWRPTLTGRLANGPLARWLDRRYGERLLATPEALRARLGRPRRILCLGNGPSSLSVGAAAAGHDLLLRVNWRWVTDPATPAAHRRPDLVLVGDATVPERVAAPLFACQNRGAARTLLLRRLLRGRRPAYRLLLLEEAFPALTAAAAAKPTNGAWMVAVAAALRPDELVIAGIDLYSHPQGRYAWDGRGANAYARVHERGAELDFMRRALSDYGGRLDILSPPLAAALDAPRDPEDRAHELPHQTPRPPGAAGA